MKNSIDVRVEFSFKGRDYDLVSHIDLDTQNHAFSIYQILAREHNIDTISYLYEVMQEADIEFLNARGIAADFLRDGHFDQQAFAGFMQDHQIVSLLQSIAKRELNIDELSAQPAIKNALLHAYKLGKGI
ncbi:MAG: hypothetical protein WCD45_01585 [Gallionella sp.]